MTPQQKDELDQRIQKIKDDYQLDYEAFHKLTEEGQDSKPSIPPPEQNYNIVDEDRLICGICCYTVYDPKFCASCYYPVCGPCRKIFDKNNARECVSCREDFIEADREKLEVQTAMT